MSEREKRFLGWSALILAIVTLLVVVMLGALQFVQAPPRPKPTSFFGSVSAWLFSNRPQISVWLIIACSVLLLALVLLGVIGLILYAVARNRRAKNDREAKHRDEVARTAKAKRAHLEALKRLKGAGWRMKAAQDELDKNPASDTDYSDLVIVAQQAHQMAQEALGYWPGASEAFAAVHWIDHHEQRVRGLNLSVDTHDAVGYVARFILDHEPLGDELIEARRLHKAGRNLLHRFEAKRGQPMPDTLGRNLYGDDWNGWNTQVLAAGRTGVMGDDDIAAFSRVGGHLDPETYASPETVTDEVMQEVAAKLAIVEERVKQLERLLQERRQTEAENV